MKAVRLSAIILLLTACSCITRPESSPFKGQWSGTWNPLGTSEPAPLQLSVNNDGTGSGTGEISWFDTEAGVTVTENIELTMEIDKEGRVAGTGVWTESISGSDDQTTQTGDLQGHFDRASGSGRFEACLSGSG
ncbi:hypothetical protein ACFL6R_05080 [Gemmatimonadota bacterium]